MCECISTHVRMLVRLFQLSLIWTVSNDSHYMKNAKLTRSELIHNQTSMGAQIRQDMNYDIESASATPLGIEYENLRISVMNRLIKGRYLVRRNSTLGMLQPDFQIKDISDPSVTQYSYVFL